MRVYYGESTLALQINFRSVVLNDVNNDWTNSGKDLYSLQDLLVAVTLLGAY